MKKYSTSENNIYKFNIRFIFKCLKNKIKYFIKIKLNSNIIYK